MSRDLTIKQAWEGYAEKCVQVKASKQQKHETRIAFYAGALSMFGLVLDAADLEQEESEKRLSAIEKEIDDFKNEVIKRA